MGQLKRFKVINCTPHTVDLLQQESFIHRGDVPPTVKISIPPQDKPARLLHKTERIDTIVVNERAVIDITHTDYSKGVVNLPDPEDGVLYIVSRLLAEKMPERKDLIFLSGILRDSRGSILGGRSLTFIGGVDLWG